MKKCSKCGVCFPATPDFFQRFVRATGDGLRPDCKACRSAITKKFYAEHREELRLRANALRALSRNRARENELAKQRRAANQEAARKKEADWREANRDYIREYGRAYDKSDSRVAKRREWRRANPDKVRAAAQRFTEANPDVARVSNQIRRARMLAAEGSFSADDIASIRKAQKDRCAYCRTKLNTKGEIDHIRPLAKGGSNYRRNLQLLCSPCNRKKHDKEPTNFARELGLLV